MHSIADYFLEVLMGRFLNPDNGAFSEAVNSEIYIDKTRLLEYTNRVINITSKFICNSRPLITAGAVIPKSSLKIMR